jgi:membrane-bound lytic murein transglycosylase D
MARARWIALLGWLVLPLAGEARAQAQPAKAGPTATASPSATAQSGEEADPDKAPAANGKAHGAPSKSAKHGRGHPAAPKHAAPPPPKAAGRPGGGPAQPGAVGQKQGGLPLGAHPKGRGRPSPRLPGSKPGIPDDAARRAVTGAAPEPVPVESPELKAMRALDALLFPRSTPPGREGPWIMSLSLPHPGPHADASGLPATGLPGPSVAAETIEDLSWLSALRLPDIPVRWEPPVVRYLEYYKNHPEGRQMVGRWIQHSGKYREAIVRALRDAKMPEDVVWLALVESAFNPEAYSRAGAAGMWQFMPATARIYGLTVNRTVDERLDPERSTQAALRHLQDLHQRFGSWELAFAAYNMGYGGVLATIRKYNTNDYWELRRLEAALPYETALYVPKIVAMAVVARNCDVFGCDTVKPDDPEPFDEVAVAPGTTLDAVAEAAGESRDAIARLNPQLRGSRTPPVEQAATARAAWSMYVPRGKGAVTQARLPAVRAAAPATATHQVRWGESSDDIARLYGTAVGTIEQLNDLYAGESARPGTIVFVPRRAAEARAAGGSAVEPARDRPLAVVPTEAISAPGTRRVFYRVVQGDALHDVARVLGVTPEDLAEWNHLDPHAALQGAMLLQVLVPRDAHPEAVALLEEGEVETARAGTDAFFTYFEGRKGRRRMEITAGRGDTWAKLAQRYGVSLGLLERINQRSRRSALQPGERVVVYATRGRATPAPASVEPPDLEPVAERDEVEADDTPYSDASPGDDDDLQPETVLPEGATSPGGAKSKPPAAAAPPSPAGPKAKPATPAVTPSRAAPKPQPPAAPGDGAPGRRSGAGTPAHR